AAEAEQLRREDPRAHARADQARDVVVGELAQRDLVERGALRERRGRRGPRGEDEDGAEAERRGERGRRDGAAAGLVLLCALRTIGATATDDGGDDLDRGRIHGVGVVPAEAVEPILREALHHAREAGAERDADVLRDLADALGRGAELQEDGGALV